MSLKDLRQLLHQRIGNQACGDVVSLAHMGHWVLAGDRFHCHWSVRRYQAVDAVATAGLPIITALRRRTADSDVDRAGG